MSLNESGKWRLGKRLCQRPLFWWPVARLFGSEAHAKQIPIQHFLQNVFYFIFPSVTNVTPKKVENHCNRRVM